MEKDLANQHLWLGANLEDFWFFVIFLKILILFLQTQWVMGHRFWLRSKGQHLPLAAFTAGQLVGKAAAKSRRWGKLVKAFSSLLQAPESGMKHSGTQHWATLPHFHLELQHVPCFFWKSLVTRVTEQTQQESLLHTQARYIQSAACTGFLQPLSSLGDTTFHKGKNNPVCKQQWKQLPSKDTATLAHRSSHIQSSAVAGIPSQGCNFYYASAFSKGRIITYLHSFTSNAVSEKHFIILAKRLYSSM